LAIRRSLFGGGMKVEHLSIKDLSKLEELFKEKISVVL